MTPPARPPPEATEPSATGREVERTAEALAAAEQELAAARAGLAPLEHAWMTGQPEPGAPPPPALPAGHFTMPAFGAGRPWPRLAAARERLRRADQRRLEANADHQAALRGARQ
jgi:hypothetical protein